MQNLNYCRQARKSIQQTIKAASYDKLKMIGFSKEEVNKHVSFQKHVLLSIEKSVKFILPENGMILEDKSLKALDEKEKINLPFPIVALEYEFDNYIGDFDPSLQHRPKKYILIAEKIENGISIIPVYYVTELGMWCSHPAVYMPDIDFIYRQKNTTDGWPCLAISNPNEHTISGDEYISETRILLSFINALQCSNVGIEKSAGNPKKNGLKSSLGFDEYNVLTVINTNKQSSGVESIGGTHRSPREHLRRGHIRRLATGVKIWVNAAVINAGIGAKIHKTYAVK